MNNGRVKIHWASVYPEGMIMQGYGYKVHNNTLREYVECIADVTPEAADAIMIASPEFYKDRVPDRCNWLFTMFEGRTLPKIYQDGIAKADYLLAPSMWVKELFGQYFPPKRVFVVNHGVRPVFCYKHRSWSRGKRFRFLWVGAPNPRKGTLEVGNAWKLGGFERLPRVELYVKTTCPPTEAPSIERRGNIILDRRNISERELVALYHSAHCFLFPTRGEGFGLTLAEAMRTGLPCIATGYSGVMDFFDEDVGVVLPYKFGKGRMEFVEQGVVEETEVAYPFVDKLIEGMVAVMQNYGSALALGRAASRRIRECFTWERSAETLVSLIEDYGGVDGIR